MASGQVPDEKPNSRPRKYLDANGKSLSQNYHRKKNEHDSLIYARWNDPVQNRKGTSFDQPGLFGIEQPMTPVSLNKQQRWKVFDDIRQNLIHSSDSSSEEEPSLPTKGRKKTESRHRDRSPQEPTAIDMEILSPAGDRYNRVRKEVLTRRLPHERTEPAPTDVTYVAVMSSRKKPAASVRRQCGKKIYKYHGNPKSKKIHLRSEESKEASEELSSDTDEPLDRSTSEKLNSLQLNDFLPLYTDPPTTLPSSESIVEEKFDPKSRRVHVDPSIAHDRKNLFYRQMSREEKLYQRDMKTYLQQQSNQGQSVESKKKSPHQLMSLSFHTIAFDTTELNHEYLSRVYGKNFIHAQCYPTKYLICLTDRLKSSSRSDKPAFFPLYSTLNCYLILILSEEAKSDPNICHGQVGLNIDLAAETIALPHLSSSSEDTIHRIDDVIEKTVEFLTSLPFDKFKPIDREISQRKLVKDRADHEMSDGEFFNQQIQQVHLLNTNELQKKLTTAEDQEVLQEYVCLRPEICTNCYRDMNESIPMTALKACAHWLCNDCWRQYLDGSIKHVKLIRCPEWNCSSVVDAGTFLSLTNIRCLNIYERQIEKCLVNLSRSYVRCALASCSNIIQILDASTSSHVQCRCGHEFCLDCKEEPHFPATCRGYQAYIDELKRNGDFTTHVDEKMIVIGRNCISCREFIEKSGGCNHMTCRCGTEFCWVCTGLWRDHHYSGSTWTCPKGEANLQKRVLIKERNFSRHFYASAVYHRHIRTFQMQGKLRENVKRLVGTIPLDRQKGFDTTSIKNQIDKRQALLEHCYRLVKYVHNLHRMCEFMTVAADGYGNQPREFVNSFYIFETLILNLVQIFEDGRGYAAIDQLNELYQRSEKHIERIRRAVRLRQLHRANATGYVTS